MAADILKSLTEAHTACRVAVYADLSVPLVLLSQTRVPAPREELNALCNEGGAVLSAVDAGEHDPDTSCDTAVVASDDGLAVFLRPVATPNEALCCLCDADLDLAAFLDEARDCLDRLGGSA